MDVVVGDHQNIQWSRKTSFEPDLPVFKKEFMLKSDIHLPKYPSLHDFFNLFLTQEILKYIVQQSNFYAKQNNFNQVPRNNLDLYSLIGFLVYLSLCKSDYWSVSFGREIVMKNKITT